MGDIFGNYGRVIKEGDAEKESAGYLKPDGAAGEEGDIYNSEFPDKGKMRGPDFFRLLKPFRLLIIVAAALISAALVLRFLFFSRPGRPSAAANKMAAENKIISYKKKFGPSVFDGAPNKRTKKYNNFTAKFDGEAAGLKRGIKFKGGAASLSAAYSGRKGRTRTAYAAGIPKKMVVFIEAGYGKNILNEERGHGAGIKSPLKTGFAFVPAAAARDVSAAPAIPEGTVMDAYIRYKIFSYNTAVPVIAVLLSDYFHKGRRILEKGDKFFGGASVRHSLDRLNIAFDKIIELSGKSINIDAIAMMPDGSGGVKGDVHHHYAGNILVSIAQSIAGAASLFAGGGSALNSSNPYTFQNQVRQNVAVNETAAAQNGLDKYAESGQNTSITLPKDTPVKIIFLKPVYAAVSGNK